MKDSKKLLKLVVLAMMVALGVVISPILRVEGMCPMAHFINIVCSVLLGPCYSLLCATLIGIIRMSLMGIPPLALTGAVFGAFFSGVFYRASKGNLLFAVLGEVIGTGIIGALLSYPVMTLFWGKEGLSWLFYVPSFICGTLIGGSVAYIFLKKLSGSGMLMKFQKMLASECYEDKGSLLGSSISIAAIGVILFLVVQIGAGVFHLEGAFCTYLSYGIMAAFITAAAVYYFMKQIGRKKTHADKESLADFQQH